MVGNYVLSGPYGAASTIMLNNALIEVHIMLYNALIEGNSHSGPHALPSVYKV
jgi:hypothetical protein